MAFAWKSRAFDICAIGILLFAYLLVLRLPQERFPEIAEYVPGEALVFAEISDPLAVARSLVESPLGRKLLALPADRPFTSLGELGAGMPIILTTLRAIDDAIVEPAISEIGLSHLALALLHPLEDCPPSQGIEDRLKENLVFWGRVRGGRSFNDILLGGRHRSSLWQELSSSQYGRHHIRRIGIGEQVISLVELGNTLAFSLNERHLRRCIDVYDQERPSLAITSSKLMLTVNGHQLQPGKRLIIKTGPLAEAFLSEGIRPSFLMAFAAITYRQDRSDGFDRQHLLLTKDPERAISFFAFDPTSAWIRSMPKLLSQNQVMLWLRANSLPLLALLRARPRDLETSPLGDAEDIIDALRRELEGGLDLLNQEIFFFADTNPEESPLVIPLMLASATINRPEKLLRRLEEITTLYHIPLSLVEQGALRYWYWSQGPMDGLVPLYGIFGSTFFLGNSRTLVERMFGDGGQLVSPGGGDSGSLFTRPLFQNSNLLLTADHLQVFSAISKGVQVLVTLTALEDRQLALHYGELFATLLGPLLESWQEPRRSLSRIRFDLGAIEAEMISVSAERR